LKEVNVARQFKALTYDFFKHYSDSLRNRILGTVEGRVDTEKRPSSVFIYLVYVDANTQVAVVVTVDRRDRLAKPFDLEGEFSFPENPKSVRDL
jgi:hypothetical protein